MEFNTGSLPDMAKLIISRVKMAKFANFPKRSIFSREYDAILENRWKNALIQLIIIKSEKPRNLPQKP